MEAVDIVFGLVVLVFVGFILYKKVPAVKEVVDVFLIIK